MLGPLLVVYAIIIVFLAIGIVFSHRHRPRKRRRVRRANPNPDRRETRSYEADPPEGMPVYIGRQALLSRTERQFYRALMKAVGGEYAVMCQVSLRKVLRIRFLNPAVSRAAFNRISRKTIDFVLCEPDSLEIIAAIELNDRNRRSFIRVDRHLFLNEVMKDAGIPLYRFPAASVYTVDRISQKLQPLVNKKAA